MRSAPVCIPNSPAAAAARATCSACWPASQLTSRSSGSSTPPPLAYETAAADADAAAAADAAATATAAAAVADADAAASSGASAWCWSKGFCCQLVPLLLCGTMSAPGMALQGIGGILSSAFSDRRGGGMRSSPTLSLVGVSIGIQTGV